MVISEDLLSEGGRAHKVVDLGCIDQLREETMMLVRLEDVIDPGVLLLAAVGTPHKHRLSTHRHLFKTNKFNIPATTSQLEVSDR